MIEKQAILNEALLTLGMGDTIVDPKNEDEYFEFVDVVVAGRFLMSAEVVSGAFPECIHLR